MKKIVPLILAFIMSFTLVSPFFATRPVFADSLEDMKREDARLSDRIKKNRKERERKEAYLKVLKSKETDSLKKLDLTKDQIDTVESDLENTERAIIKTKQDIETARVGMSKVGKEVDVKRDEVGKLLTFYYKSSEHRFVDVVFSSQSLAELLTRSKLTKLLVDGTAEAIRSLHSDVAELDALKLTKQQNEAELKDLQSRQKDNRQMLVNLNSQYNAIYKKIKEETVLTKAQIKNMQNELARDAARKKQLAIEVGKEIDRRRALEGKKALQSSGPRMWPLIGRTDPKYGEFGMRMHPIRHVWAMHEGIDIDGKIGDPIRAVADGVVGRAAWLPLIDGFGNCVIIYHGNGVTTYYAHMSRYNCKTGQEVKKGDIIGFVGSTGNSTGPHLHLEFRENGKPVNPRNYLPKL